MKKLLFSAALFLSSFTFASNVHLDPKITNALNPAGNYVLWENYKGSQNQSLYPSNTEVKINSTAFDDYARFSFYRSSSVTSYEPALFNTFATDSRIPYTFVWSQLPGDNKRQTLYAKGTLTFQQNNTVYTCQNISFFTTSNKQYIAKNSRFEDVLNSWIATDFAGREPVMLKAGNSINTICYQGATPVLFNIVMGAPVDGFVFPMTFNKVHEYNLQEPSDKNLDYVMFWTWNHVNGEYGEKRFMDNGRFDTADVKGIRINNTNISMETVGNETVTTTAVPQSEGTDEKVISISSEYENKLDKAQDYNSPTLSYAMAKAYAIAHASAFKSAYSTKAKVKMPLLGDVEHTITLDYTGTTTTTETTTDTVTINIQSQKITVQPGCTVQVAQVLNTSKETGYINISSKIATNAVSEGVLWKSDGSQIKVKGTYNLYDLMASNNPNPSESWIQVDNKNKVVKLKDLATYTATRDNSVITKIYMTCKGKTTVTDSVATPANY